MHAEQNPLLKEKDVGTFITQISHYMLIAVHMFRTKNFSDNTLY